MRALLDINVIIALLDTAHTMHHTATEWLEGEVHNGWASCPITENGVVRIMSQPAYPNSRPPTQIAQRLHEAKQNSDHSFWHDDISLTTPETIDWRHMLGHRQITDAYLLSIAARNEGRFVTLDQRISHAVVKNAAERHLHIIYP